MGWNSKMRRRQKYNARRTEYNDVWYDSKAEAARARDLDTLERAGEIDNWERQPTLKIVEGFTYRADFQVWQGSSIWYEDVKGRETQRFKDVRRLWRIHGWLPLVVLKRKGDSWDKEVINPVETDLPF